MTRQGVLHSADERPLMSVSSLLGDKQRELLLLGGVLSGAFALVSVAGFQPTDPTWLHPGTGLVENPCGPAGALIADVALTVVGYGAYALVVPMGVGVLALARRPLGAPTRWVAAGGLYVTTLATLEMGSRAWPGSSAFPAGGTLGATILWTLESVVGTVGASLALFFSAVLMITVLGKIEWRVVASWLVEQAERAWPPVRAVLARMGLQVGQSVGQAASWSAGAARDASVWSGQQAAGASKAAIVAAGGGVKSLGGRTLGALRRMGRSLFRAENDREPDWTSPGTDAHTFDMSNLPPPTDHTQGGTLVKDAPLAVVEVEWDPTASIGSTGAQDVLGLFPDFSLRDGRDETQEADHTVESHADPTPEPEPALPSMTGPIIRVREPTDSGPNPSDNHPMTPPAGLATPASVMAPPVSDADPVIPFREPPSIAPPSIAGLTPAPSVPRADRAPSVPHADGTPSVAVVHDNPLLRDESKDDGREVRRATRLAKVKLPALKLLDVVPEQDASYEPHELQRLARVVEEKLETFKIGGTVTGIRPGPVVTILEFQPDAGIRVARISKLGDDLAMAMEVLSVRIVAPIPGRGVVGIEIPSQRRQTIFLRQLFASPVFRDHKGALPVVIGKDVEGKPVVADLAKMPHLLVGGTTGSGKSVGVNGMLLSLLFTKTPDELRLLLVDPKMLEFDPYRDIPHLLHPIITEPKKAASALMWACDEMDDRYRLLARWGTRNISGFNEKVERESQNWTPTKARKYADPEAPCPEDAKPPAKMPYIVIVIDELADLMMMSKQEAKEAETAIVRIAQKARACGIHLIVATQRPSADVVTGLIKANLPTRISFQLRTNIDSRTILDTGGAEQLLGRGDMLYLAPGVGTLQRCHGAFVSDDEVNRVNDFLRHQAPPEYLINISESSGGPNAVGDADDRDELFQDAVNIVLREGKASTSMLQRHLKIGYNRAARIVDDLEMAGIIGPADGARPREVLV
ncbi:MAG: DNA translocase FtsK [Deltaproteobacteria bacterium]|nr:MAG: DNA translocase FtsK [Deltaproteobacteria bacterium]